MRVCLFILSLSFILVSCSSGTSTKRAFIGNQTQDSITIAFDAFFVNEKTKNDVSKQQFMLVPVSEERDFTEDSAYWLRAIDLKNQNVLPYLISNRRNRRNPADTGLWISKYNSKLQMQYRLTSLGANEVYMDTLSDSTVHFRLTLPPDMNYEMGTIGTKGLSDSYFENFSITYKDPATKKIKIKQYENYGKLKKDFQKFGDDGDSAVVVP